MVWVPKLGGTESDVPEATRFFPDARGRQYWDEGGHLMHAFTKQLAFGRDAWDIYFIYGPDARWDEAQPPKPAFWMHQLGPGVSGPALNGDTFKREALARLGGAAAR